MNAVSIAFWGALGIVATALVAVSGYSLTRKAGASTAGGTIAAFSAASVFIMIYIAVSTFIMQYLVH
jgi:hypothetical protein